MLGLGQYARVNRDDGHQNGGGNVSGNIGQRIGDNMQDINANNRDDSELRPSDSQKKSRGKIS